MKKLFSLLAVLLFTVSGMLGQSPSPGILNYQGVARNSVGNVLVNKTITLRLTIRDGAAAGPTVYQETRTVTTNPFGLFNVQLGSAGASSVTGTIPGVPWGVGLKYIQVEIDPNGGSTFINIGTAQLASVPYSLYSSLSNDLVLPFNKTQSDAGTLFRVNNSGTGNGLMGTAVSGNGVVGSSNNAYGVTGTTGAANGSGVLGDGTGGGVSSGVMGRSGEGSYPPIGFNAGVTGRANANVGVAGYAISGTGVYGSSGSGTGGRFTSTSGLALHTSGGGVRLQNINEGVNRILATIPGDGTATWQDPSVIGIVTGSGTLNYHAKWTPNGTNLGNSIIWDDGTFAGVGTTSPFSKLTVVQNNSGVAIGGGATTGSEVKFLNFGTAHMSIYNRGNNALTFAQTSALSQTDVAGTALMTLTSGGNLGIGTVTPSARLSVNELFKVNSNGTVQYANAVNPMMIMFESGTSNADRMVVSHSPAFPSWGLQYQDSPDKFNFISAGTPVLTADLGNQRVGVGTNAPVTKLQVMGSVNITDGTQGVNRVFFDNGAGVGTGQWSTLAGAGIVGGSGTLNRVAKWTPDGFNIGNSLSWDDGNRVRTGLGPTYTDNNTLTITTTSVTGNNAVLSLQGQAGDGNSSGIYLENAVNKTHLTVNNYNAVAGTKVMTWDGASLNVGIGTPSPAARLHALSTPVTAGPDAVLGESDNTDANAVAVRGVITSTTPGAFSAGIRGANNGTGGLGIGVYGSQAGSGWGVYGTTPSGVGVFGSSPSGTGVYASSNSGIGLFATSNSFFAAQIVNSNAANGATTMVVNNVGTNSAASINVSNAASTANALSVTTNGVTGRAGSFQNISPVNTAASLLGINTANNIGSWGINAISQTGTGYPGEATHAGLVAASLDGVGTVTSSPNNYGLRAGSISNHSIFGENYGGGGFAGVFGISLNGSGYGVAGNVPAGTGAGGYFTGGTTALRTLGGLQLTGINEAPNRILTTIPGTGQATWEDAATVGIVSGSGTLNYIPKWTPNGTTLGNSLIQDDGNAVKLGNSAFYNNNSLNIYPTPTSPEPALMIGDGEVGGLYLEQATGRLHVTLNNPDVANGGKAMTFDDATLNVGIGTTAPVSSLQIVNPAVGKGGLFINQDNELLIPAVKSLSGGPITTFDLSTAGMFWGDNSIYAQRNDFTTGTVWGLATDAAISGFNPTGTGVKAMSVSGFGLFSSSTSGTAHRAFTVSGTAVQAVGGTGVALQTSGAVIMTGIGEANGYVLTSDATGNATWQDATATRISFAVRGLTSPVSVPFFTYTPITQWAVIDYEEGSVGNYNAGTGEYTVPKTGKYNVSTVMLFNPPGATGSGYNGIAVFVNGNPMTLSTSAMSSTMPANGMKLSADLDLNAGDLVTIQVYHNTSGSVNLNNTQNYYNTWSIHLIK